jgi:hypothetical protein
MDQEWGKGREIRQEKHGAPAFLAARFSSFSADNAALYLLRCIHIYMPCER